MASTPQKCTRPLILFQTPKEVKSAKWHLLKLVTSNLCTVTVFFVWQPIPLFPFLGAFSNGVLRYFGKTGTIIALNLVSTSIALVVSSIISCMTEKVVLFLQPGPIANFFKNQQNFVLFFTVLNVLNTVILVGSIWMATTIDPAYMTFVNQKGPQGDQFASFLQTAMSKQDSAFLIDVTRNGWAEFYCFYVIFVCVASLIGVTFLNIKIKKIFDQTKDIVTKKTQEMQNNLIKTLKFLTQIFFFFLFLPLCLTFLNILGVIENLYIGMIAFNMIPFHAILVYIFMIVNMKPYRNFVLKVIKKTIRMTVREKTNTTDSANKVVLNLNKRRQTLEPKNVKEAW